MFILDWYQDLQHQFFILWVISEDKLRQLQLRSNLIIGIFLGVAIGVIIAAVIFECYIYFMAPDELYKKLPDKFKEKYVAKETFKEMAKEQLEKGEKITKEVIIREKIKVTYTLPDKCPKCKADLNYEDMIMKGPNKVKCSYCNSVIDLIEKEI